MRIGFATVYSWRPHVEHLYFLATLARKAGHECFFLACDADLPDCYTRELRGRSAWRECLQCRAGGIRSFSGKNVSSIGEYARRKGESVPASDDWAIASASTLGRYETLADYAGEEFRAAAERLRPAVQITFDAARSWIVDQRLDSVCVFNGRIDATRAIFEAARSLGVRVVSLERTWFGDGLQLLPEENCLGLQSVHEMVRAWRDVPLTRNQALRAASHVARRFLRTNFTEWRAYNVNARNAPWPIKNAHRKILLIPGSRNETWGHPDWVSDWAEPVAAYEAIIERLGLGPREMIIRCHPNWSEKIGKNDGWRSERYYSEWAARNGILCIPGKDPTSTLSLIAQCDAVVVSNSSAALEAGFLGKQIIGTAPSAYQEAGMRDPAYNLAEVRSLVLHRDMAEAARQAVADNVRRQTLRFCYTMIYRVSQYTDYVKAESTTRYRYHPEVSPQRFLDLLRTGRLVADDEEAASDANGEDEILSLIARQEWERLGEGTQVLTPERYTPLSRRALMKPIDLISNWKPVGDR